VLQDFDWSEIACEPGDIGITRLKNLTGDVVSHDEGSIPTFEATTSRTDALARGTAAIRQMATAAAGVPNITFQNMHVIPKYMALLYYPVWVTRYMYNERAYFATIDAVTGQVLSGRAPGDPLYQSLAITGGAAGGGILAGAGILWGILSNAWEYGLYGLLIGVAILAATYYFFRHGSEITEGDIKREYGSRKESMAQGLAVAKQLMRYR